MVSIWGDLPQVAIKPKVQEAAAKKAPVETGRILQSIGQNPVALNTLSMEQSRLRPAFKDFNPEEISPNELNKVGKQLFAYGLVDNLTADLMGRAALEFDNDGKIVHPEVKINVMEFFAARIDEMQKKVAVGDKYAKLLLPDYIKAVHVMQNLHTFATTGDSYSTIARDKLVKEGKAQKIEPMKMKL